MSVPLRDGKLVANIYVKETEKHQYFDLSPRHPCYCIKISHDISNIGQPRTFPPGKIYRKNIEKR